MELDLKVERLAKKPDFTGFRGGEKWFKCTDDVYSFLNQIKPCIITIGEQIDEVVKRVNLVKKLDSPALKSNEPLIATPSKIQTSKNLLAKYAPEILEFLADAEETILKREEIQEKRRPTKAQKEFLSSLRAKKERLYKLMDVLE